MPNFFEAALSSWSLKYLLFQKEVFYLKKEKGPIVWKISCRQAVLALTAAAISHGKPDLVNSLHAPPPAHTCKEF